MPLSATPIAPEDEMTSTVIVAASPVWGKTNGKDVASHDVDAFSGRFEGLRNATIMMVDDEPTTLDILQMYLEDAGYQNFLPITDSTTVLARINARAPDVLLLDLMMPDVGGLQILEALRADEALEHLPIIILTSSSDAETKLQALELGATDFLAKPVDASELALRLRNTLAAKAYQDRLAYYDGPTGLPNRDLFAHRLDRELHRASRGLTNCAVLNVALDRFDQVSEALGQCMVDELLRAMAERLEHLVRPEAGIGAAPEAKHAEVTVARTAGNQFALLLPGLTDPGEAGKLARRLLAELVQPFAIGEREQYISPFIGIALHPTDGDSAQTLLEHAAAASSQAMAPGGNAYRFYSEEHNTRTVERLGLENDLYQALKREELEVYFQPKLTVHPPRVVGAEALLRWHHPQRGLVPPDEFIPVAEEAGLIVPIGEWVIRRACAWAKTWDRAGFPGLRVAVNVSAHQFVKGDLVATVRSALDKSGLPGERLVVEVTESTIMDNPAAGVECLEALRARGVTVSVDDFGTGYSSLTYLKRFPVGELKIDQSFIQGLPAVRDDVAITSATIAMAHGLGLKVVAEGIENRAQLEFLRERRCDEWQGFLCSKPLPGDDFVALLQSNQRSA